MPAAPSRKPAMPAAASTPGTCSSAPDEEAAVPRRAVQELQPVAPELGVRQHPRLEIGGIEHGLELVRADRRRLLDALDGPGHALDEHLVRQRAQVSVAQPDVPADPVALSPVEGATHTQPVTASPRTPGSPAA